MATIKGMSTLNRLKERSMNLEVPSILSMVMEPRKKLVKIKNTLSALDILIIKQRH
tara:strand:- start:539 stop:706 length:168 start_codon:yes stop_codon:yes gene_type:complete